jgi:hypothetical protein
VIFQDNKINIKIGFRLFVAGKNKQEKKIWLPINLTEDFSIEVTVGTTTFDEYQKMVINACNKAFPNSGPIIKKDLTARAPQIKWYGTIPKTPNFLKKDKYQVTDHASYSNWVKTAYDVSRSEIGLLLKMSNPAEAIKRAQREDLLAAQADHEEAVQIAAAKRKASNGDDDNPDADADDELDPVDWERINTHMKKIYAANLTNVKYDQHLPVYIDPTNPHRYILITPMACQEWARALVRLFSLLCSMCQQCLTAGHVSDGQEGGCFCKNPTVFPCLPHSQSSQKSSDCTWRLGWQ